MVRSFLGSPYVKDPTIPGLCFDLLHTQEGNPNYTPGALNPKPQSLKKPMFNLMAEVCYRGLPSAHAPGTKSR